MENKFNSSVVYKAGGIIIRGENPMEVLLLYRAKQDDWTFPKGHAEDGETYEQAALREIREETGLSVEIVSELPSYEYESATEKRVKTIMYLMKCADDSTLKEERKGDKLAWISLSEVSSKLSYEGLKIYFEKAYSLILKI